MDGLKEHGRSWGAAAEVDGVGEQQLKWTQSGRGRNQGTAVEAVASRTQFGVTTRD